jgi:hypothetical protein
MLKYGNDFIIKLQPHRVPRIRPTYCDIQIRCKATEATSAAIQQPLLNNGFVKNGRCLTLAIKQQQNNAVLYADWTIAKRNKNRKTVGNDVFCAVCAEDIDEDTKE